MSYPERHHICLQAVLVRVIGKEYKCIQCTISYHHIDRPGGTVLPGTEACTKISQFVMKQ